MQRMLLHVRSSYCTASDCLFSLRVDFSRFFFSRRITRYQDGISEKYVQSLTYYISDDYYSVSTSACLSGNCAHLHKKAQKVGHYQQNEREKEKERDLQPRCPWGNVLTKSLILSLSPCKRARSVSRHRP